MRCAIFKEIQMLSDNALHFSMAHLSLNCQQETNAHFLEERDSIGDAAFKNHNETTAETTFPQKGSELMLQNFLVLEAYTVKMLLHAPVRRVSGKLRVVILSDNETGGIVNLHAFDQMRDRFDSFPFLWPHIIQQDIIFLSCMRCKQSMLGQSVNSTITTFLKASSIARVPSSRNDSFRLTENAFCSSPSK